MPDVLASAEKLFQTQGFQETSLHQIAENLGMAESELEKVYPSKEHLALAIYHGLSQSSADSVCDIPAGSVAERYFLFLEARLATLSRHDESISALFAAAMLPKSSISPAMISPAKTDPILKALRGLVAEAEDAPKDGDDLENMALLLYSFHFLLMLFGLYDRTEQKQASVYFVQFLRDFVKLTRPMMVMPLINKALHKLTQITLLVFGGAKLKAE